jgi:hypothetical protein
MKVEMSPSVRAFCFLLARSLFAEADSLFCGHDLTWNQSMTNECHSRNGESFRQVARGRARCQGNFDALNLSGIKRLLAALRHALPLSRASGEGDIMCGNQHRTARRLLSILCHLAEREARTPLVRVSVSCGLPASE